MLRQVLGVLTGYSPVCSIMKSICQGPEVTGVHKLPVEMANQYKFYAQDFVHFVN